MAKFKVTKFNESYLKIIGEPTALSDLVSYFKYHPQDYKYHPKYKAGIWDGYISMFTESNCKLFQGLVWDLPRFCRTYNHTAIYDPSAYTKPMNISREDIAGFIAWVNPLDPNTHKSMEIRDYQAEVVYKALKHKKCNIIAPTSSGKTVMMYLIARFAESTGKKMLIIVPNTTLVKQTASDFRDYGYKGYVHTIYSGQDKSLDNSITVSTWQSMKSILEDDPKFFNTVDVVMADEAHTCKEFAIVTKILEACSNASFRYGMTGTFPTNELNKKTLIGLLGPSFSAISIKELMEKGHVAPLDISCISIIYDVALRKHFKNAMLAEDPAVRYHREVSFIKEKLQDYRFPVIEDIIRYGVGTDENCLVLFDGNEYGKELESYIESKFPDRKVFLIYGKIETEERMEIIKIMKETPGNVLVASTGTFSTGVNIPFLNHIIFASGGKSTIRVLQSIGRGIRLHASKKFAKLWDIHDNLDDNCYSVKHATERMIIYSRNKFKYKTVRTNAGSGEERSWRIINT